jgi:hypothetical protein
MMLVISQRTTEQTLRIAGLFLRKTLYLLRAAQCNYVLIFKLKDLHS